MYEVVGGGLSGSPPQPYSDIITIKEGVQNGRYNPRGYS
jgi:hypothetical protein